MRSVSLLAIFLILVSAVTACTVMPKVKYLTDTTSDMEGVTMFHLVDGSIVISKTAKTEENTRVPDLATKNDAPISDVSVTVVPKAYSARLYGIVPQSQYLGMVDTNIAITFYDNSRVVHKLGVEVVDNRIKTIEAIGAIAGAAASGALFDEEDEPRKEARIAVPVVLDPKEGVDKQWHPLPGNEAWAYRIKAGAEDDKDAVPAEGDTGFFKKHDLKGWFNATSAFPISSCKQVTLELSTIPTTQLEQIPELKAKFEIEKLKVELKEKERANSSPEEIQRLKSVLEEKSRASPPSFKPTKEMLQAVINQSVRDLDSDVNKRIFALKVPEPEKVRLIGMPPKGEITTHTLCGANTASQPSSAASAYDVLSALMKQVQAIYEAQKAKKE